MSQNYTIKDIAAHANVGTTTVSRVLNDHPYVSAEKRQRVLDAIEELNYRQNLSAKWLRSSNTGLVGFLTDDVATTPYAVDIIRGAQDAASACERVLLVVNANRQEQSLEEAVEFLLERQVSGIVYAAMFHREVILPKNIYQVPTALANCYVGQGDLPSAIPDEFIGGYRATHALLEAGHKRIAHLQVVPPAYDAREGRLAGYQSALEDYDIPFDPALCVSTNDTDASVNYRTTQHLLNMDNPPTAFFCANDRMAMATYFAILQLGLQIPDDISVVGFDNQVDIGENILPQLTTVQLPHYEMGKWAFNQLFEDNTQAIQAKIECALVKRESVKTIL